MAYMFLGLFLYGRKLPGPSSVRSKDRRPEQAHLGQGLLRANRMCFMHNIFFFAIVKFLAASSDAENGASSFCHLTAIHDEDQAIVSCGMDPK